MRVRCIYNQGKELPEYRRLEPDGNNSEYPLTIGMEYNVYGVVIGEEWIGFDGTVLEQGGNLDYFIRDDNGHGRFYPVELFEVMDSRIPGNWKFSFRPKADPRDAVYMEQFDYRAIFGYDELVLDKYHYVKLVDFDSDAIAIFKKRCAEIDSCFD